MKKNKLRIIPILILVITVISVIPAHATGIPRESIMACGDGDNDVHLLREVGFGVAMANAQSQVKDVADYITSSNDEDGVARAIEKFALHR